GGRARAFFASPACGERPGFKRSLNFGRGRASAHLSVIAFAEAAPLPARTGKGEEAAQSHACIPSRGTSCDCVRLSQPVASRLQQTENAGEKPMARLKFGAFLAPHHPIGEHPMLQFRRDLDFVEQLDNLGYDEFWCGEHHSSGWEMIAS